MNTSLLLDLYELTMAESYFTYKRDTFATFDLFVRELASKSRLSGCLRVRRYFKLYKKFKV